MLILLFFLAGCFGKNDNPNPKTVDNGTEEEPVTAPEGNEVEDKTEDENNVPQQKPEESEESVRIQDYYPPELKVKYFKGEGNEFATEVETLFQREGEYLSSFVNNGGTQILKVYQLSEDGIYVVYEQPEYYEENPPNLETIKNNFQQQEILTAPIEEGHEMEGWKIVAVDETISLPIGNLDEILILEKVYEDGSISKNYWAKELGVVKKEYYYKDGEKIELAVTSELERVEELSK